MQASPSAFLKLQTELAHTAPPAQSPSQKHEVRQARLQELHP